MQKGAFKAAKKQRPIPLGRKERLRSTPYSECETTAGGVFKAEVRTTSCFFRFRAVAPKRKDWLPSHRVEASRCAALPWLGLARGTAPGRYPAGRLR
jgi:hypothetical protein